MYENIINQLINVLNAPGEFGLCVLQFYYGSQPSKQSH